MLPEYNLSVQLHGVRSLVVDHEMDEVLLGRPFLKSLGFDLETHLEKVGKHIGGKHIDEIDS